MTELAEVGTDMFDALTKLRGALDEVSFPLPIKSADAGHDTLTDTINQLDDYILPRYAALDAPLLAVVGGSTGAGKSAIVNSLIGETVSSSSAIRPTTRRPLLVHAPEDSEWFSDQRILPGLARVSGQTDSTEPTRELEVRAVDSLPRGLALVDSPDIDSVVTENRQLAAQLLAAADLWIFVTTAARYADAIPWALLDEASERNIVAAVVLNRVPTGVGAEVRSDLAARLSERGLASAPLFVISEQELPDGRIPEADIEPLRGWLRGVAQDENARSLVARQTLGGAVDSLGPHGATISGAYKDQLSTVSALGWDVDSAFSSAQERFEQQLVDGSMLRGEVLARWQDVVGAGEWTRKLESGISSLRDRIVGYFKPQPVETSDVEVAIEEGIHGLVLGETEEAVAGAIRSWENFGLADEPLAQVHQNLRSREQRSQDAGALVRRWQDSLLAMIREEGGSKKTTARWMATGVNAIGVALIIVIFASTGGLVGGEIAVAGGTAIVAQKLLEAIFGEDAVRRMAKTARQDLVREVKEFMEIDRSVFTTSLADLGLSEQVHSKIDEALSRVARLRDEEATR